MKRLQLLKILLASILLLNFAGCQERHRDRIELKGRPAALERQKAERPLNPTCFARDNTVKSRTPVDRADFPRWLSQTGCVDFSDPKKPAIGLIPYEVVAPLWSDGSDKLRFFAIPDGASAILQSNGHVELPVGSVTMKIFKLQDRLVETRIFMRERDGHWAGYSYAWLEDESDAELLTEGMERDIADHTWVFPSRSQCAFCHNQAAAFTLGWSKLQLSGKFRPAPDGSPVDQLEQWMKLGIVKRDENLPDLTSGIQLVNYQDRQKPIEDRARSYLHANCSSCHRPGGGAVGGFDLRIENEFSRMGLCGKEPLLDNFGFSDARIFKPRDPNRSILYLRMKDKGSLHMPPQISRITDENGLALIRDWILLRGACDGGQAGPP